MLLGPASWVELQDLQAPPLIARVLGFGPEECQRKPS